MAEDWFGDIFESKKTAKKYAAKVYRGGRTLMISYHMTHAKARKAIAKKMKSLLASPDEKAAGYGHREDYSSEIVSAVENPGRRAGVKLARAGHTGFLKCKAVDVITRGGRVVEVKVKR